MNSKNQNAEIFFHLMKLIRALDEISPNRFLNKIVGAKTACEVHDTVLALQYAANSKELRDTGDKQVHILCEEIRRQAQRLNNFFVMKLFPSSLQQKQSWEHFVLQAVGGKYAFSADGSLEISLLDAELRKSALRVKRIWGPVSSYDGSTIDFEIKLDANQISNFKARLADSRLMQSAIIEVIQEWSGQDKG
jgi:hypothetical protein